MVANSDQGTLPASVTDAVLVPSNEMPEGSQKVEELDFNKFAGRDITVNDLISGMNNMGFQASSIGEAVRIINDMVSIPLSRKTSPFSSKNFTNKSAAHLERPRRPRPQNHNLPRLHQQPDFFRSARHPPLPSTTLPRQRHRHNRRWDRRRPNKMPRRHVHGLLLNPGC